MKFKLIPLLVAICVVIGGIAVYSLIAGSGDYDPMRYITLPDYKAVTITVTTQEASEEEIAQALAYTLQQMGTTAETDAPAVEGDVVSFTYTGKVDGKTNDSFCGANDGITLGQDEFLVSGLDDTLLGKKKGDSFAVTLTVQADYHLPEYAGKAVAFTGKITKVAHTTVPELTDKLAASLGDYKTAEEFKTAFAEKYREERKAENAASIRSALWSKVVEDTKVSAYPEKEMQTLRQELDETVKETMKDSDMTFIDAAAYLFGVTDQADYEAYALDYCQRIMKQKMVLKAICSQESIVMTEDVYQAKLKEYLAIYADQKYTEEDLLKAFGDREGLEEQFLMELATDVIQKTAVVNKAY